MKIALASTYLGQMARGVETWATDLAAELARRGMDVTLFRGGGPGLKPYEQYLRCTDHRRKLWKRVTAVTKHGGWRWGLSSASRLQQTTFAWRVAWRLRRGRFAIVHLQDAWAARVLESLRRCGLHRAKVILGHGTQESFDFLMHLDHVQELAPCYLEQDRQQGLPASRRWFAIPNFVDCRVFRPGDRNAARARWQIPADRLVVVDVAALTFKEKNLDLLIQELAKSRLRYPQLFLLLAGSHTPEAPQLEQLLERALPNSYRMFVNVPRVEMPAVYQAGDLFVHATLREQMPISLLEAMACGLPVICNATPVMSWIVGDAGRPVEVAQSGQMSNMVEELLGDSEGRATLSQRARQRAESVFDTPRVTDEILKMYEQTANPNGR